jgi:PhzF family phenazine biosynthesis protein
MPAKKTRRIPVYQLDVFAERLFAGNPAAVLPLDAWPRDATMQSIATEINFSDTAFFVREQKPDSDFHLRWFTPANEIELCGHATLATGYVLMAELGWDKPIVRFRTLSGVLAVERKGRDLWLDLPAQKPEPLLKPPAALVDGLRSSPQQLLSTPTRYFAVYRTESDVAGINPDMAELATLGTKAVVVTAPGGRSGADYVARFFAPGHGIPEDPATGSSHCLLVPYWSEKLGLEKMEAVQLSQRGAKFSCELAGDRVRVTGPVRPFLKGEISVA